MKKYYIFEKTIDLVECNIFQNNHNPYKMSGPRTVV